MLKDALSSKIRLLQIIPSLSIGGAERSVVYLAENINRREFDVAVCVLGRRQGTFLEKELLEQGIPTFFLNIRWTFHPLTIRRLSRLFADFKPDVIHSHLRAIRYVLIPSCLRSIPVHIHTICSLAKHDTSFFYRWLNRIAFKYLGIKPVSISKEVARTVKEVYGVESLVIYNGIPTSEYNLEDTRSPAGEIRLLNVGKFKRAKNHLLLVEAFAKAVAEEPRLRLILAGDGSLRKKAERRVRQLGLKDKVDFLGWRSDIPILLKDCDIFVLSSDWEGFGNVLVEAMSAGKPIVATRVGGVPEVVEDGVTGFLVPPRDADVFASAILKLVREKRLREEMGRKGREKAVKEFDISIVTREYERLYKEALNRQR